MSSTRSLIGRVRNRMALASAVEDLQRGVLWGTAAAAATVVAARIGLGPTEPLWAAIAGGAVAAAFPAGGLLLRRRDERVVAAAADERLGLAERVSTALWVETRPEETARFGPLVVADAESCAAAVPAAALRRAFRPRLLRVPLIAAGALALVCAAGILLSGGATQAAAETDAEKVARLADASRLAEVARKMKTEVKRVEDAAAERKEAELQKLAGEIRKKVEPLTRAPAPVRQEALKELSALADLARDQARKAAGMRQTTTPEEAQKADRELHDLLESLHQAGLESLEKDLSALEKRLKSGEKGEAGPSPEDVRKLAKRIDALRSAMERMAADDANSEVLRKLRSLGNEALLAKIAERLRQIAARLDRGQEYESLQGEDGEPTDLSEMSEEDLQKLLDELEQLAAMQDLEKLMRDGSGELIGGRKLRLGGIGGT